MTQSYNAVGSSGCRPGILDCVCTFDVVRNFTQIIDGNNTGGNMYFTNQSAIGKEWRFKFNGLDHKRIMDAFTIYCDGGGKGGWSADVQGSNDNSAWTTLTSFTMDTNATQEVTWANTTAYQWYRIIGTAGNMSWDPYWREIEFRLDDMDPVSRGNRAAIITVTTNMTTWSGTVGALIDGNEAVQMQFDGGQSGGKYLQFDFDHEVLLKAAYTVPDGNGGSMGQWKWQRYDFGAAAWVDISDTVTWWSIQLGNMTYADGENWFNLKYNDAASTRYRMLQTGGSTQSLVWREFEFATGAAPPPSIPGTLSVTEDLDVFEAEGVAVQRPPIEGYMDVTEPGDSFSASGVSGRPNAVYPLIVVIQ